MSVKQNCASDWWWNKLNYSGRITMIEKHYPHLFHILEDVTKAVTDNMIIDMYEEETK